MAKKVNLKFASEVIQSFLDQGYTIETLAEKINTSTMTINKFYTGDHAKDTYYQTLKSRIESAFPNLPVDFFTPADGTSVPKVAIPAVTVPSKVSPLPVKAPAPEVTETKETPKEPPKAAVPAKTVPVEKKQPVKEEKKPVKKEQELPEEGTEITEFMDKLLPTGKNPPEDFMEIPAGLEDEIKTEKEKEIKMSTPEKKEEVKPAEIPVQEKPLTYDQLTAKLTSEINNAVKDAMAALKESHRNAIPKKPVFQSKEANDLVDYIPKLNNEQIKAIIGIIKSMGIK